MERPTNYRYKATNGCITVYFVKATCPCDPTSKIYVFIDGCDEPIRTEELYSLDDGINTDRFVEVLREFKASQVTQKLEQLV